MTKPKPLPDIARCACGRAATIQTIQTIYSKEYLIVCDHYKCFNGPWRRSIRGAILAWNRVMNRPVSMAEIAERARIRLNRKAKKAIAKIRRGE